MKMVNSTSTIHVMVRIWWENGRTKYEEEFLYVYSGPELILDLPFGVRPTEDHVNEVLGEIELHEFILPDKFEVCEEPIIYEAIGEFTIMGYEDYWGEYDEDYDFVLHQWSCDIDEYYNYPDH